MIASIVHPALANHAPLASIVGARIYRDHAGDEPTAPYVIWSDMVSVGSTSISRFRGYAERVSVTVDVFTTDKAQSETLRDAARDAAETIGKISSGPQNLGRDEATKLYRYTMTVDVFKHR